VSFRRSRSGVDDFVAGLVDRLAYRRLVESGGAGDGDRTDVQVDLDIGDAVQPAGGIVAT
jgi:hypothetical protein